MPFKSPEHERAMFANAPKIAREWVHKYGHAKGYVKPKKKRKIRRRRTR